MGRTKGKSKEQKKLEKIAYKADRVETKAERDALIIETPEIARGNHNCPVKDAGTTHAFRARCFSSKHAGHCPACGLIFHWDRGCRIHEVKREGLLGICPSFEQRRKYCVNVGLDVPTAKGKHTTEVDDEGDEPATSNGVDSEVRAKSSRAERGRGRS